MHSDYRYDPFLDVADSAAITDEAHMIPADSPYDIRLHEVPLLEAPSSIRARIRDYLTAEIATTGATTCTVANGAWFANGEVITIESEQLLVTNVATNTLTITRGYNSTTASSHAVNTAVYGPAWAEVAAPPAAGQIWPDYDTGADGDDTWNTGRVRCNSADAGKILSFDYSGTGTLASVNPARNYPQIYSEYGDGSYGHFVSTGSDTIDGLKQYKSMIIQAGHTVTVGSAPLHIACQGPVIIAGTINGAGGNGSNRVISSTGTTAGGTGKGGGADGGSVTTNGSSISGQTVGGDASGAGGGSAGVSGGKGCLFNVITAAGAAMSAGLANMAARFLWPSAGAGGAGASAAICRGGGGGGGSLLLAARRIVNTGTITTAGGAFGGTTSSNGGSGGGGGASIRIVAPTIVHTGTITVAGGQGGNGAATGTSYAGGAGWSAEIELE